MRVGAGNAPQGSSGDNPPLDSESDRASHRCHSSVQAADDLVPADSPVSFSRPRARSFECSTDDIGAAVALHWAKVAAKRRARKTVVRRAIFGPVLAVWRRGIIFNHHSWPLFVWDWLVCAAAVYSTTFLPLALVFPEARWSGSRQLDVLIDAILLADVAVRARTSFFEQGYDVTDGRRVTLRYLRGWACADLLSALPYSALAPPALEQLAVLRLLALGRPLRMYSKLISSRYLTRWPLLSVLVPVACLVYLFLLCAHWLALGWYSISIAPLEVADLPSSHSPADGWWWEASAGASANDRAYATGVRYVCSMYWALSVMTSLKTSSAHESRHCLARQPLVTHPLEERIYTVATFLVGAVFFSCIYGNIAQSIASLGEAGLRYRQRMSEIDQFAKTHRITAELQRKLRHYVHFQWSVTKGLDVDAMAGGLPAHLTLEVRLQLYQPMVRKVTIFAGCPAQFFEQLTSKLSPLWVPESYFVFYEGESGHRMFFIQRGTAHVQQLRRGLVGVLSVLKEGDYFGELSLLMEQPRSTDVLARTDLMLLALTSTDFFTVLRAFPDAKMRIQIAAEKKAKRHIVFKSSSDSNENSGTAESILGISEGEDRPGDAGSSSQVRCSSVKRASICRPRRRSNSVLPSTGTVVAVESSSMPACNIQNGAGSEPLTRDTPDMSPNTSFTNRSRKTSVVRRMDSRRVSVDTGDRIQRTSSGSNGSAPAAAASSAATEMQVGSSSAIATMQTSLNTLNARQKAVEQMLQDMSRQLDLFVGQSNSSDAQNAVVNVEARESEGLTSDT
jgi:CRP/FNR family cyclic AMP-dependent transcriptional regulator